jgi:hypothetical protein
MKNGDDATGLVERLDKPFLTIAAARTAATTAFPTRSNAARINIVVEAGTYSENIILRQDIRSFLTSSHMIAHYQKRRE